MATEVEVIISRLVGGRGVRGHSDSVPEALPRDAVLVAVVSIERTGPRVMENASPSPPVHLAIGDLGGPDIAEVQARRAGIAVGNASVRGIGPVVSLPPESGHEEVRHPFGL
jgi:hypothetical protein